MSFYKAESYDTMLFHCQMTPPEWGDFVNISQTAHRRQKENA